MRHISGRSKLIGISKVTTFDYIIYILQVCFLMVNVIYNEGGTTDLILHPEANGMYTFAAIRARDSRDQDLSPLPQDEFFKTCRFLCRI